MKKPATPPAIKPITKYNISLNIVIRPFLVNYTKLKLFCLSLFKDSNQK